MLSPDLIVATATGTVLFNGEPPLSASRQDASDSEDIFTSLIATAVARGSLAYWTIDEDQQQDNAVIGGLCAWMQSMKQ